LVKGGSGELAVSLEVDEEVENLAWFEIRKRNVGAGKWSASCEAQPR
jgi:hypothetical protein